MILPVFKPVGDSTHQLAVKAKKIFFEKATHTGTLDPIASGVVTVLIGDDRLLKAKLSSVEKTYCCTVLLGISTDTHDILGLIDEKKIISESDVKVWIESAKEIIGSHKQRIPDFSAKRWNGKSFFDAARKREELPRIAEKITVHHVSVGEVENVRFGQLVSQICQTIDAVVGDFRQEEILKQWKVFAQHQETACTVQLEITCSKRTYIRGLVRDISQQSGVPACILSLTRTQNGLYGIADCICLL